MTAELAPDELGIVTWRSPPWRDSGSGLWVKIARLPGVAACALVAWDEATGRWSKRFCDRVVCRTEE